MVNTRSRSKTLKTCLSHAFIKEADHQSGALVDDLLTEILLRLPVASILRFKSVCKHWRSLLSHRDFTLRYDNLIKTQGLFACSTYIPLDAENRSTPPFRSLDFCIDPSGIKIVQSCNGLLLCCSKGGYRIRSTRKYYIFNPTTKQFAILPSVPGGPEVRKTIRFMVLVFHQTDCPHYKVVCIRTLEPCGELHQIQIYSSDTGKWKVSVEAFSSNYHHSFHKGVYLNGVIHMLNEFCLSHFYFKIDIEQLQTLPMPAEIPPSVALFAMYFGESRGHLHLIVKNSRVVNTLNLNVYEMLSDHSGWFVKYQLQLGELPAAFPEMVSEWGSYYFEVLDVVRGEKDEDTFLVLNILTKIIKCNIYDKSFQQIFSLCGDLSFAWCQAHRHIATVSSF